MWIALRIAFTALIAIGSAIALKLIIGLITGQVSRRGHWSSVDGTVLAASIYGPYYYGDDSSVLYHFRVRYEYEVGGKRMVGKQTWNERSRENVGKWKKGMSTTVWYDPLRPKESVVAGKQAPLRSVWLIGAWMVATGVALVFVWLS